MILPVYSETEAAADTSTVPKQVSKTAAASSDSTGGQTATAKTGGGVGMGGGMMMGGYGGGMAIPAPAEPSSVLIIPKGEQDPLAMNEIMEDGKIMSQIISESIPSAQGQTPFRGYIGSALYNVFGSAGQVSCLYIEQYGMIFVRQVDYPLLPSEKTKSQPQQDKDTDKVWQKAKRTVQGDSGLNEHGQDALPSYDSALVEQLKQSLIGSLKHASNIRRLKPEDYVVIVVRYNPPPRRDIYPQSFVSSDLSQKSMPSEPTSSFMIIRAAKKDIDKIDDDSEFQIPVEVIVY
jgi:hypothetical protein